MYIEVIHPDGKIDAHTVTAAEVVIGRSPDADISLSQVAEIEPFHLLVSARTGAGCWVSVTKDARTQVFVAGQRFENGTLDWGAELDVGSLILRLLPKAPDAQKSTMGWWIVALVVATAGMGAALFFDAPQNPLPRAAQAPNLFAQPPACPESGPEAGRRAQRTMSVAQMKGNRYPYDAAEGVETVDLLSLAQTCFEAANLPDEAERARKERERMMQTISEDYQFHRLRLDRSIGELAATDLVIESRALLELVPPREGAYREWLVQLQRWAEISIEQAKKKKKKWQ